MSSLTRNERLLGSVGKSESKWSSSLNDAKSLFRMASGRSILSSSSKETQLERVSHATYRERLQYTKNQAKVQKVLDELSRLPEDEVEELQRSEHFDVLTIVRRLIEALDEPGKSEQIDQDVDRISRFIEKIQPRLVSNANKKQHIVMELEKQQNKLKIVRKYTEAFRNDLERSTTFNDNIFASIMSFEKNMAVPQLNISLVNSVISSYYTFSTPPDFVALQQSVSQMLVVYAQLVVLGNQSLCVCSPPASWPSLDQTMWNSDPAAVRHFEAQLALMQQFSSNLAVNLVYASQSLPWSTMLLNDASRHLFNMPIMLAPKEMDRLPNIAQQINMLANESRFPLDDVLSKVPDVQWSDCIKLASYTDPDSVRQLEQRFAVSGERVVDSLVAACNSFSSASNKLLNDVKQMYKRKTPDIVRHMQAFNASLPEADSNRRYASAGWIATFVNLELLRANPKRYELLSKLSQGGSKFRLQELEDKVGQTQSVRAVRMLLGLLWQGIVLLEFLPLYFEYVLPLRSASKGGHFASLYTQLANLTSVRNSVLKSFWIGVNRNGIRTLVKLVPQLLDVVGQMTAVVASFVMNINGMRQHLTAHSYEGSLLPLRQEAHKLVMLFLTGQENGDSSRIMKALNPSAQTDDANLEELENALGAEDYKLDVF